MEEKVYFSFRDDDREFHSLIVVKESLSQHHEVYIVPETNDLYIIKMGIDKLKSIIDGITEGKVPIVLKKPSQESEE